MLTRCNDERMRCEPASITPVCPLVAVVFPPRSLLHNECFWLSLLHSHSLGGTVISHIAAARDNTSVCEDLRLQWDPVRMAFISSPLRANPCMPKSYILSNLHCASSPNVVIIGCFYGAPLLSPSSERQLFNSNLDEVPVKLWISPRLVPEYIQLLEEGSLFVEPF